MGLSPVEPGTGIQAPTVPGPLVITGGAQGIGLATATRATALGVRVALLDKAERELENAVAMLGEGQAISIPCDVSEEGSIDAAFARVAAELGAARGVVANAGIERLGRVDEMDTTVWDEVMATNLRGTFLTCRAALRAMAGLRAGSIVCVSSPISRVAIPGSGAYGASKAGVSALARAMALDHASDGIRVNSVIPGATETTLMWGNVEPQERDEVRAKLAELIPAGRLAAATEPAEAIVWLLSEAASYVTGTELICDGGLLARAAISV